MLFTRFNRDDINSQIKVLDPGVTLVITNQAKRAMLTTLLRASLARQQRPPQTPLMSGSSSLANGQLLVTYYTEADRLELASIELSKGEYVLARLDNSRAH